MSDPSNIDDAWGELIEGEPKTVPGPLPAPPPVVVPPPPRVGASSSRLVPSFDPNLLAALRGAAEAGKRARGQVDERTRLGLRPEIALLDELVATSEPPQDEAMTLVFAKGDVDGDAVPTPLQDVASRETRPIVIEPHDAASSDTRVIVLAPHDAASSDTRVIVLESPIEGTAENEITVERPVAAVASEARRDGEASQPHDDAAVLTTNVRRIDSERAAPRERTRSRLVRALPWGIAVISTAALVFVVLSSRGDDTVAAPVPEVAIASPVADAPRKPLDAPPEAETPAPSPAIEPEAIEPAAGAAALAEENAPVDESGAMPEAAAEAVPEETASPTVPEAAIEGTAPVAPTPTEAVADETAEPAPVDAPEPALAASDPAMATDASPTDVAAYDAALAEAERTGRQSAFADLAVAACTLRNASGAHSAFRKLVGKALRTQVIVTCREHGIEVTAHVADPSATDLARQAEAALAAGDAAEAFELAKRSNHIERTSRALIVMGLAACSLGDRAKAKALQRHLTRNGWKQLVAGCKHAGVDLGR